MVSLSNRERTALGQACLELAERFGGSVVATIKRSWAIARTIAKSARQPDILSAAKNLHPCGETLRYAQGDNYRHFLIVLGYSSG